MRSYKPLILSGLVGLLVANGPVVHGQTVRQAPFAKLTDSFFGAGPEIGVTIRDVTADDGTGTSRGGAVVEQVRGESPAARAGIQAGDVILTYDGEAVRSARQLARLIDETPQDKAVPLSVTRSGKRIDLSVTPESNSPWSGVDLLKPSPAPGPEMNLMIQPRNNALVSPGLFVSPAAGRLGIQTQELSAQLGEYFGATSGVLVSSVNDNTPARAAGLRAGDVITKVDGQAVQDGTALRRQLTGRTGKVVLTVVRDRTERTLDVDIQSGMPRTGAPRRYER